MGAGKIAAIGDLTVDSSGNDASAGPVKASEPTAAWTAEVPLVPAVDSSHLRHRFRCVLLHWLGHSWESSSNIYAFQAYS
eukprot:6232288-Amphidinium_carterae.1